MSYKVYASEEYVDEKFDSIEGLVGTTLDVTPSQVFKALSANKSVCITYNDEVYGGVTFTNFSFTHINNCVLANLILNDGDGNTLAAALYGFITTGEWRFEIYQIADTADIPSKDELVTEVLAVLPTWNGGSY